MRTKDYRRHQEYRAVARVEGWMRTTNYWGGPSEIEIEEVRSRAKKRASHPQCCSLSCCGNPRKWWKTVTRQEERAELRSRDEF